MALDFKRVQKSVRKIRKLLKKMSAKPTLDQVHDFRTNSRQMEATLESFGLTSGLGRRVLKPLSRLRKRAGKIRDMDVLTGHAAGIHTKDSEQDCAVELLEYLGAQRRKHARKFHSISRQDGPKLRRRLKRAARKFAKLEAKVGQARRPKPKPEPSASALALGAELASTPRLNRSSLHPFRLKVKELRNVLKLAQSPDHDLVNALGDVKDAIGEWHDWQQLVTIAEKASDHGTQCKLIQELKTVAAAKYGRALSQAEKLRDGSLGASAKKKQSGSGAASEEVLHAAMKLAA